MRLSAPEEYGFRCVLQLARAGDDAALTLPEIARREGMTLANAGKILAFLKRGRLVASVRGRQGGYRLARPADRISVADVLVAMSGGVYRAGFCGRERRRRGRTCVHMGDCSIRSLWTVIDKLLRSVLEKTTVRDLIRSEPYMMSWLGERFGAAAAVPALRKEDV
jgi:Rrf2 family transcriptional regulator, iron-sulfur cluster assembly transcription factor